MSDMKQYLVKSRGPRSEHIDTQIIAAETLIPM